MPTISGLRRRGYTPESIREFVSRIGIAKRENLVDVALLEDAVRDDLNKRAPRAMAVLNPLKVIIENYPPGQVEDIQIAVNPEDPAAGTRTVPFSRELLIERDDFMEDPPKKFFRLAPGREVRLRGTYFLTCQRVVKDASGAIVELRCTYDPATKDGNAPDGRRPKSTIHWVSDAHAVRAEVRLYDRLFTNPTPGDDADGGDWRQSLNPHSLDVLTSVPVEPGLAVARPGDRFQFERIGYFCVDTESAPGRLVLNRTVPLKDSWTRLQKKA
jgi:glutaminyl-tRNA synthetase